MTDTRIYRHPKRPEWGMAIFNDEIEDRVRFVFEDAQIRAFKSHQLDVLEVVELPDAEAAKLRSELGRKRSVKSTGLPKKKAKPRVKPRAVAPVVAAEKK